MTTHLEKPPQELQGFVIWSPLTLLTFTLKRSDRDSCSPWHSHHVPLFRKDRITTTMPKNRGNGKSSFPTYIDQTALIPPAKAARTNALKILCSMLRSLQLKAASGTQGVPTSRVERSAQIPGVWRSDKKCCRGQHYKAQHTSIMHDECFLMLQLLYVQGILLEKYCLGQAGGKKGERRPALT